MAAFSIYNCYRRVDILLRYNKLDYANEIVRDYPECIAKAKLPYFGMHEDTIKRYEYYLNNGWKITHEYVDKLAQHIVAKRHCTLRRRWKLKYLQYKTQYLYILLTKYNAPITDNTIMVLLNDIAYMLKNNTSNKDISDTFIISLQDINTMIEDSLDLDDIKYIDIPYYGIDKKTYINVMLEKIPRSCASSTRIFKRIVSMRDKELLDKYLNICEQFNTKKELYKSGPYMWCYEKKLTSMFKRLMLNEIPINDISFPLDDAFNYDMEYYRHPKRILMLKMAVSLGYKIGDNIFQELFSNNQKLLIELLKYPCLSRYKKYTINLIMDKIINNMLNISKTY
jgi:hypothetical protein